VDYRTLQSAAAGRERDASKKNKTKNKTKNDEEYEMWRLDRWASVDDAKVRETEQKKETTNRLLLRPTESW